MLHEARRVEDAGIGPADLAKDAAPGAVKDVPVLSLVGTGADDGRKLQLGVANAVYPIRIKTVDDSHCLGRQSRIVEWRDENNRIRLVKLRIKLLHVVGDNAFASLQTTIAGAAWGDVAQFMQRFEHAFRSGGRGTLNESPRQAHTGGVSRHRFDPIARTRYLNRLGAGGRQTTWRQAQDKNSRLHGGNLLTQD